MKHLILASLALLGAAVALVACGGGAAAPTPTRALTATPTATAAPGPGAGDPIVRGLEVFKSGTSPTCGSCHAVKGVSTASIGPDLSKIGTDGARRRAGMSAEAYVRESLVSPGVFVVSGYAPTMPPDLVKGLSPSDLDALVAYLLSLK